MRKSKKRKKAKIKELKDNFYNILKFSLAFPPPHNVYTIYLKIIFERRDENMRIMLAIFLPFVAFFTIGRPFAGIICMILQFTFIGWIPAAMWAVYALSQYKTQKQIQKAVQSTAQ